MSRPEATAETGRLWIEEGEPHVGWVAEVAPLIPVPRTYTFSVSKELEDQVRVGQRVRVPIGRRGRPVPGFITRLDQRPWDNTLRPIASLIDDESFLTPELVALGKEIAAHYVCPLAATLKAMTPEPVRKSAGSRIVTRVQLAQSLGEIEAESKRLGDKQRAVIMALTESDGPRTTTELGQSTGASTATIRTMEKRGWVSAEKTREMAPLDDPFDGDGPPLDPDLELNPEQSVAADRINSKVDAAGFSVTLLFGVSGSGKTEVYIHALRQAVAKGKQGILLVPEIVLTTQLVQRLTRRLPDVVVLHSGLTDVQRSAAWRLIASGRRSIVIGTRSAVFAPCPNVGVIVVDEEQETSYKNLQAPRFHVRDVAIMRGQQLGIPVVLGSATPSLEVWKRSTSHPVYERLDLKKRVRELSLPEVRVVDMRAEWADRQYAVILSNPMEAMLAETLDRGEQAMLLMNRRGFARRVYCPTCGSSVECPRCNAPLVVHTSTGQSVCHYCNTRMNTPKRCTNLSCDSELVQRGLGTQRVEERLIARFPDARIRRVDSDTMTHRREYEALVEDFAARRIDVLVGTQMIAKGLDFPYVSFVGVIDADPAGIAADFRASERLFQLVTQVAGRAGRADRPGRALLQTTMPDLPALKLALTHDYESFAEQELDVRRRIGWPPFTRLARLIISHTRDDTAAGEAASLAERIAVEASAGNVAPIEVWGPQPCRLKRLRGRYRHQILVRAPNAAALRDLMGRLQSANALRVKAARVTIDVDPVSMV